MKEEQLNDLKKAYLDIKPKGSIEDRWKKLSFLLPQRKKIPASFYRYALILTLIFVFLISAASKAVLAVKPGNPLYPIKKITDNLVKEVSKKIPLSNRENKTVKSKINCCDQQGSPSAKPTTPRDIIKNIEKNINSIIKNNKNKNTNGNKTESKNETSKNNNLKVDKVEDQDKNEEVKGERTIDENDNARKK